MLVFGAQSIQGEYVLQCARCNARNRVEKVNVVVAKRRSWAARSQIDDADCLFHGNQRQTQNILHFAQAFVGASENSRTLPDCPMNQFALNLDRLFRARFPAPGNDRTRILLDIGLQQHRSAVGGNHFEDQLKKFALQQLHVADGIDDIADSEQCCQVARHVPHVIRERRQGSCLLHQNCFEQRNGSRFVQACPGSAGLFIVVHQKHQL